MRNEKKGQSIRGMPNLLTKGYITYLGNDPLDGWYLLTFNYARGNKRVSSVEFIDEDTARFSLGLAI